MFSNQKVNPYENTPASNNTIGMIHEMIIKAVDPTIITHEGVTTMAVRDDDWTIEIGIVAMIINFIKDGISRPEMQAEAFHPEIGVKHQRGEIACLISSGKK